MMRNFGCWGKGAGLANDRGRPRVGVCSGRWYLASRNHRFVSKSDSPNPAGGVAFALAAYASWGIFPIYFHALATVHAPVILAHRIVWSALFMLAWIVATRRLATVAAALRSKRVVVTLLASTLFIACNWLVYIGAVTHGHVLEASLGYFINPLVTVALGAVFLRERLSRRQKVAVGLALAGVVAFAFGSGVIPTVALVLAGSFAGYGLLRKTVAIDAAGGLFVETAMLFLPALGYLGLTAPLAAPLAPGRWMIWTMLLLAGPITAVPLLWFANAARRLPMGVLGFFQYVSPTLQLGCAVLLFGEKFTRVHGVTFALIWTGVAVFLWELHHGGTEARRGGGQVAIKAGGEEDEPC